MCFWNLGFVWNLLPARVEQSFERDEKSPARRAGGTIPLSARRSAIEERHCQPTENATDSSNV